MLMIPMVLNVLHVQTSSHTSIFAIHISILHIFNRPAKIFSRDHGLYFNQQSFLDRVSVLHRVTSEVKQKMKNTLSRTVASALRQKSRLAVPTGGAWDSHLHILEPARHPATVDTGYKLHEASLASAQRNAAARLGVTNFVFVQPSPYGTDNSCQLEGLQQMTPQHSRAVIVIDPASTTMEMLQKWHDQGVRGVRVNLKSSGTVMSQDELAKLLHRYADIIRPLRTWCLQLYADLHLVPTLVPLLKRSVADGGLGVKVVLDHMGSPPSLQTRMEELEGWPELLQLMRDDVVYVKVSAPYRFTKDPEFGDCEHAVKSLLAANEGRNVVFASDWPHTRFENTDIEPWVHRCLEWCDNDEELCLNLFKRNAERLWDVQGS